MEELAKDSPSSSTIPNELDIKVHSLINAINMAMAPAILKARLSPKSVPRFDEECKKMQIKAKKLKKDLKKRRNKRNLRRLLDYSSRKKADDSKSQKKSKSQVKRKSV